MAYLLQNKRYAMRQKPNRKLSGNDLKPSSEEISAAAYQLYVDSGCKDGHDQEHWLLAETLLSQNLKTTGNTPGHSQTRPIQFPS